jgi:hypothetical protein
MRTPSSAPDNVVRFRSARSPASAYRDQKSLMDAVYGSGSLPIQAEDRAAKVMASRLQVYGFVAIEEIRPDGTARRLRPSESIHAALDRPWRVSKPSWHQTRASLARTPVSLVAVN